MTRPSGFPAAFLLLHDIAPTDRLLLGGHAAEELARHHAAPHHIVSPCGLAFGEAIGLAWAARRAAGAGAVEKVLTLVSSDELATGLSGDLARYAVRQALGNLCVVVHAAEGDARAEERVDELATRGWLTHTVGAHDREAIASALRRPAGGRPTLLFCLGMRRPQVVGVDALRAALASRGQGPAAARAPAEVEPEGGVGDVGAFAVGVGLHGAYAPSCRLPLAEAFALTPVLRRAARLRLPLIVFLSRDGDEPADALPALRLIPGLAVGRAGGDRAAAWRDAVAAGGPHALVE